MVRSGVRFPVAQSLSVDISVQYSQYGVDFRGKQARRSNGSSDGCAILIKWSWCTAVWLGLLSLSLSGLWAAHRCGRTGLAGRPAAKWISFVSAGASRSAWRGAHSGLSSFPTIWTDEGARVTGLDVELTRAMTDEFSRRCGQPVIPVLHLVRFRDLFRLLNEGHLDWFVSAVATNTPCPFPCRRRLSLPIFMAGASAGSPRVQAVGTGAGECSGSRTMHPAADRLAATSHALDG